jgi:hypothetical protein
MHHLFEVHIANGGSPTTWRAKLTMGELKPHVTSFVETGITALKTPEMKATIRKAFEEEGLFNIIRGVERQQIAEAESLQRVTEESRLVLPFTFGDLRRSLKHLNKDSLNAVEGQEELHEENDEEIPVAADEDSDSDEEEEDDE